MDQENSFKTATPQRANKPTDGEIIRELATPTLLDVDGLPVLVAPEHMKIHAFTDRVPPVLTHTKADVAAHDITGFTDYVNLFKRSHSTQIFAALEPRPRLKAVIDYHSTPECSPDYCAHIVTCEMKHSEEFLRWKAADRKPLSQKEFGSFIEDNAADVIEPTGAALMEMALNFSSMRDVEFRSSARLQSGEVQFTYNEKERAGEVRLPERIKIALPVFRGDTRCIAVTARVKYRITEFKLQIWLELERLDRTVDVAYQAVIKDIAALTGIAPIRGMTGN